MAEVQSLDQFRARHARLEELPRNPPLTEVVPIWTPPEDDGGDDGDDAA